MCRAAAPLGTVPALAAKGIRDTGNPERTHRNGPVVTAGGLIFVGTWGDRTVRAFDKDTGKVFCASGGGRAPEGNIAFVPGKIEAQGYYVFALPSQSPTSRARSPR
jgi:quinoprotein glucose dehydrogenase